MRLQINKKVIDSAIELLVIRFLYNSVHVTLTDIS